MRRKNTGEKVDTSISAFCECAKKDERVSAIIFVKTECKSYLKDKLDECGCRIKYDLDLINAFAVEMYASKVNELAQEEKVLYIAGDIDATTCMDIARQSIGEDNIFQSGANMCAAVLDTGIHPHSDLTARKNRIVASVDFVNGRNRPYDDNGHGTHCAGIIASDGISSQGRFMGIAPEANLISLKVMNQYGEGSASDILAALDWVNKNREKYNIKVVSMSLGAQSSGRRTYDPLVSAVNKLWDNGLVVVAAAGNEGPSMHTIGSPGVSDKIITVGCSDDKNTPSIKDDSIAEFSSRGPSPYTKTKPDIVAPGVDITSLSNNGGYISMSGTSMATPIISGCCLLLLEKYPNMTNNEVKRRMMRSTNSLGVPSYVQGRGLIDVKKMMT